MQLRDLFLTLRKNIMEFFFQVFRLIVPVKKDNIFFAIKGNKFDGK